MEDLEVEYGGYIVMECKIVPLTLEMLEDMKQHGTHVAGVSFENRPTNFVSKICEPNEYNTHLALHSGHVEIEKEEIENVTVNLETGEITNNGILLSSYKIVNLVSVLPKIDN